MLKIDERMTDPEFEKLKLIVLKEVIAVKMIRLFIDKQST